MNAPTQLDPELSRTATRLRSAAPNAGSATRPALADIQRGAHHRRTRRRMASGVAAVIVLGTLTATTIAVRRDGGSTAGQTLNDPIDVAIAQTQPLVPTLGPGERFDYAFLQGGDQPGSDPDQVLVIADHDDPTLFDRSVMAVVVPDPDGTAISGLTGWETPRTIAGRQVAQLIDRTGPQFRWTKNGTSVWLQGRNMTVAELETIVGSVTELGVSLRVASNPLSMRVVEERARPAAMEFTLQWTADGDQTWTFTSVGGARLIEWFYMDVAGSATTVRGSDAVVFTSNGGLAIAWEEPRNTVRLLTTNGSVSLDQLRQAAEALTSIDVPDLRSVLAKQGTTVDSNLFGQSTADNGGTANTMVTATTAVATAVTGNRLGDAKDLTTGTVLTISGIDGSLVPMTETRDGQSNVAVVRGTDSEPWALMLYESNPAGGCYITPIPGASITDPDAPFFTNECDHSTYTMDGRCLDGCTIGLYAIRLDEHDGAIWGDISNYDKRRPKA